MRIEDLGGEGVGNVLKQTVVMVTQLCKCTKNLQIVLFQWVNFRYVNFTSISFLKNEVPGPYFQGFSFNRCEMVPRKSLFS